MTIVTVNRATDALYVLTVVRTGAHYRAVSYRPRSVPPASDWGRFLVRMRRERDWSATQAHEALHDGLGLGVKSRAAYVAIEDGRALRTREEAFLRSYFGGGPTDEDRIATAAQPASDLAPYLERIDALVGTVQLLVEELRIARGLSGPELDQGKAEGQGAVAALEADTSSPRHPDEEGPHTDDPETGSSAPHGSGKPRP